MLETGVMTTDTGEVIARPGMSISEFTSTRLGARNKPSPTGPGWQQVGVGPFMLHGLEMLATGFFYECRIGKLLLMLSLEEDFRRFGEKPEQGPSAPQTVFYRKFVEDDTKGPSIAAYEWGDLAAYFDAKSYTSGIVLAYAGVGVTERPRWR